MRDLLPLSLAIQADGLLQSFVGLGGPASLRIRRAVEDIRGASHFGYEGAQFDTVKNEGNRLTDIGQKDMLRSHFGETLLRNRIGSPWLVLLILRARRRRGRGELLLDSLHPSLFALEGLHEGHVIACLSGAGVGGRLAASEHRLIGLHTLLGRWGGRGDLLLRLDGCCLLYDDLRGR